MYGHCVGIAGSIMCWVAMVKLHLVDDANVRWNAVRFMLAAAHVEFYGLSGGQLTAEEWLVVQGRNLLTDEEVLTIKKYKGFKPFLPIYWALCEVRAQLTSQAKTSKAASSRLRTQSTSGRARLESGGSVYDFVGGEDNAALEEMMIGTHPVFLAFEWDEFSKIAFELRGHCSQIANLLKQPVPWAYFHLLNLSTFLVLFLYGYGLVDMAEWPLTVLVYAVVCLIFMGMKELSVAMADPFGDDVIDFKIEKYMAAMYDNAISHLEDHFKAHGTSIPAGINNPLPPNTGGVDIAEMSLPSMPPINLAVSTASQRHSKLTLPPPPLDSASSTNGRTTPLMAMTAAAAVPSLAERLAAKRSAAAAAAPPKAEAPGAGVIYQIPSAAMQGARSARAPSVGSEPAC